MRSYLDFVRAAHAVHRGARFGQDEAPLASTTAVVLGLVAIATVLFAYRGS